MPSEAADMMIKHQIGLERVATSEVKRIVTLLSGTQDDIRAQLQKDLKSLDGTSPAWSTKTKDRLLALQRDVKEILGEGHKVIRERLTGDLVDMAKYQADWLQKFYNSGIVGKFNLSKPSAALLRAIVTSQPFEGRTLKDWAAKMERDQLDRIMAQIRLGMVQGESVSEMMKRLQGTSALKFRDGQFARDKRGVEILVRTASAHVANRTQYAFIEPYKDDFARYQWLSILDQRTTPQCRALNGKVFRMGEGPWPPLHPRCRSTTIALSRFERAADYGGESEEGESFSEWLKRQDNETQADVLGEKRAREFRAGKFDVDSFIERPGSELTLEELSVREAAAFEAALGKWEEEQAIEDESAPD